MSVRFDFASGLSRRSLLLALLSVPVAAKAAPVDGALGGGQAEWRQGYDSASRVKNVRSSTPILSQGTLAATEQVVARYQQIVAAGGWGVLPSRDRLKLGSRGPGVIALRQRLIATGDMDATAGSSPIFDSYVEASVKRFQGRHGLGQTGVVGAQTYAALNVPAEVRLRQLEINLVRLRSYSGNLGNRYVTANIPAAYVETVENGVVATRHAAVVGKQDRQSPVMTTKISEVNFNPFWTVPSSIIRKDLIPKMQAEPNYLTENKIRIFNGAGQEVSPQQINWNSDEALNYRFRQDPGAINSMGSIRVNTPSPHGVYMHDTPAKGLFGDDYRFHSSGCMRVQNVREYVAWLLKDTPGWDRSKIVETINSGARVDARMVAPVNTYWVYITAWATPEGVVQFRDDIYGKDGFGPGAVTQALRQGDDEPAQ
jgi:murein L,D-transpeptidase YcbB/YkuD